MSVDVTAVQEPLPAVPAHVPLAVTTRGRTVENVHFGSVAVVNRDGRVLRAVGDVNTPVFTRSACKPFQAAAFVAAGGLERFGFSGPETALLCASHSGEPVHTAAAREILARIGCSEDDLQCGTHPPMAYRVTGRQPHQGEVFTTPQHNCSGKHAGMLAFCRLLDVPVFNYLAPDHPVQQRIRAAVAHFLGMEPATMPSGVDGCSAPNFAAPLTGIARAFSWLACGQRDDEYGDALARLRDAMTAHPEMVSGQGRFDLAVMHAGGGGWVSKEGAEAVHGLGIAVDGVGVAVKVADGNVRILYAVVCEVLRQLGRVPDPAACELAAFHRPAIRNWRRLRVGDTRCLFRLRDG